MSRSPKLPPTWRELNVLTDLFAAIIHSPNQVWANSLIFDFYHLTWIAKETGLSLNARRPDRTPAGKTNMSACHIRKNLAALRQFHRVALNSIRDLPEAFKPVSTFLSLQVKCFYKQFKI